MVRATNTQVMASYEWLDYENAWVRVLQKWLTDDGQPPRHER